MILAPDLQLSAEQRVGSPVQQLDAAVRAQHHGRQMTARLLAFSPSLSAQRSAEVAGKLALLQTLAARYGRREPGRSVLELALLHRHIGLLVGASRSTVSMALTALVAAERVRLLPSGGFELPDRDVAGGGLTAPSVIPG